MLRQLAADVLIPEGVQRDRHHAEVVADDERGLCESAADSERGCDAVRDRQEKEITRARARGRSSRRCRRALATCSWCCLTCCCCATQRRRFLLGERTTTPVASLTGEQP